MRKRHTIREWEEAIAGRSDIKFENIRLVEGFVWDVRGTIILPDGREKIAYWLESGKCFSSFRGCVGFDIKFRADD